MTGEQFHDVLSLLPEDLVAQADQFRQSPKKVIRWKQYAAIAACFGILLCAAAFVNSQESAPTEMAVAAPYSAMKEESAEDAAAPQMEAAKGAPAASGSTAMADSAIPFLCVETPVNVHSTASFVHGPSATGITSRGELDAYLSKWDRLYLMEALRDACEIYDEGWFSTHDLLLIPADGVSAGQTCIVTEMSCQDGQCDIVITLTGEETDGMTNYHIAIPVDKGAVSDSQNITTIYISDTNG